MMGTEASNTKIRELQAELTRLLALEAKLPKCWGLRDGVLVQDVVVVPGMFVWARLGPSNKLRRCEVCYLSRDSALLMFGKDRIRDEWAFCSSLSRTREAAEKRGDV